MFVCVRKSGEYTLEWGGEGERRGGLPMTFFLLHTAAHWTDSICALKNLLFFSLSLLVLINVILLSPHFSTTLFNFIFFCFTFFSNLVVE